MKLCQFKAKFSTPKGTGKFVREPPDPTKNEPILDMPSDEA